MYVTLRKKIKAFDFYLFSSSFFFSDFTFYKEALCFITLYTFIMFKHVNFGKHIWIRTSKIKKNMAF